MKSMNSQVQEAQQSPSKINTKKVTIIIILLKTEEKQKLLKAVREKRHYRLLVSKYTSQKTLDRHL